jgi:DNA-binding response OmpR family regulator
MRLSIINKMPKRILIVEDDQNILSLLKDILEREGYEVTGLHYTESIIKSIEKHPAELVMLDFLLQGINGGELCHDLKSQPATASLPVIMLSAFPRVIQSLGNYGADVFIAKPFDVGELLKTVHNCLDPNWRQLQMTVL